MARWNGGGVLVIGSGIGGLTLGLQLHREGVPCHVSEAAPLQPLGVGISLLPHATCHLHLLGLDEELDLIAVSTQVAAFCNRFGQLTYEKPVGISAGHEWPQYICRGYFQPLLRDAVPERLRAQAVEPGARFVHAEQGACGVTVYVEIAYGLERRCADVVVGRDGVYSAVRGMVYPDHPGACCSGYVMWRGATIAPPYPDGATMARAGWLNSGKVVIYLIRDDVDGRGNQLVDWVAKLAIPQRSQREIRRGDVEDMIGAFAGWHFDWLDVPALIRSTETIAEWPVADQEPLDRWSFEWITRLGDAAHPMLPGGSNGAAQAMFDARCLADGLAASDDVEAALVAWDAERRELTARVVLVNHASPPDAILGVAYERSGGRHFDRIDDLISRDATEQIITRYRMAGGLAVEQLTASPSRPSNW